MSPAKTLGEVWQLSEWCGELQVEWSQRNDDGNNDDNVTNQ